MTDETFTRAQLEKNVEAVRADNDTMGRHCNRLAAFALKQMDRAETAETLLDERDAPYAELAAARKVVEAARKLRRAGYPEIYAAIAAYDRAKKEQG